MRRLNPSRFAPLAAAPLLGLLFALAPTPARAQPEEKSFFHVDKDPNDTGGNPAVPGYVATAFLAAGALFVLCKSARR